MSDERKLGPNMKRLLAAFAARISVPPGGGMADAIAVLTTPGRLQEVTREALKQADIAVAAMRAAPDNPYGDDEETIAGALMEAVDKGMPNDF